MRTSIANLLDFLAVVFSDEIDLWYTTSTEEEAVRAIARSYPYSR
jgi:hypothetical protein